MRVKVKLLKGGKRDMIQDELETLRKKKEEKPST